MWPAPEATALAMAELAERESAILGELEPAFVEAAMAQLETGNTAPPAAVLADPG